MRGTALVLLPPSAYQQGLLQEKESAAQRIPDHEHGAIKARLAAVRKGATGAGAGAGAGGGVSGAVRGENGLFEAVEGGSGEEGGGGEERGDGGAGAPRVNWRKGFDGALGAEGEGEGGEGILDAKARARRRAQMQMKDAPKFKRKHAKVSRIGIHISTNCNRGELVPQGGFFPFSGLKAFGFQLAELCLQHSFGCTSVRSDDHRRLPVLTCCTPSLLGVHRAIVLVLVLVALLRAPIRCRAKRRRNPGPLSRKVRRGPRGAQNMAGGSAPGTGGGKEVRSGSRGSGEREKGHKTSGRGKRYRGRKKRGRREGRGGTTVGEAGKGEWEQVGEGV